MKRDRFHQAVGPVSTHKYDAAMLQVSNGNKLALTEEDCKEEVEHNMKKCQILYTEVLASR